MEKVYESQAFGGYMKTYDVGEIDVVDVLEEVEANGFVTKQVEILEGVERDMKTIDGMTFAPEEFKEKYLLISIKGRELRYVIYGEYNTKEVNLSIRDNSTKVSMFSTDANLELDDLYKKKAR